MDILASPGKPPSVSSAQDIFSGDLASMRSSSTSCESSRANSPTKRPVTPPTPSLVADYTVDHKPPPPQIQLKHRNQDEYLQLIEPNPVFPPAYDTLPPGGCPRFPVYHQTVSTSSLSAPPAYTPSIYKIGVVSRKVEWLTPYEPSPSRLWKSVIIELNSTQLNFYQIPNNVETHLLGFKPTPESPERRANAEEENDLKRINSDFTDSTDLQFFKYCQRLNLLNDTPSVLEEDLDKLTKKTNSKRLVRSYSLQHAKIGLAADYKKRPNVLRLRIESEQILLHFATTKDLIEWNMSLGIGRDVALDLNERDFPRFRTVPRRRRRGNSRTNNVNNYTSYSLSTLISDTTGNPRRNRSNTEPSRFKGKFMKLKSKLSSSSSALRSNDSQRSSSASTSPTIGTAPSGRLPNLEITRSNSTPNFTLFDEPEDQNVYDLDDDDDDTDYYDDEETYELLARSAANSAQRPRIRSSTTQSAPMLTEVVAPTTRTPGPERRPNEEDEDDIQNMSDLHHSDDEEDADEEDVVFEYEDGSQQSTQLSIRRYQTIDYKWNPVNDRIPGKRKFYRNCLRCIKPLTMEDTWVSKTLAKPTTLSPLNFAYLRNIKYNTNVTFNFSSLSNPGSSTSLASLGSVYSSNGFKKNRSFSFKDVNGFNLPDSALTKIPNHFLKEYIVGTHGLIPKEV